MTIANIGRGARLDLGLEPLAELERPAVRGPHRVREERADAALLELVDRGRARPAGRGDGVAQLGRVKPGSHGVLGRADEGLGDEVVRELAREAEVHAGVDERLHDGEEVGRPGPRQRGRHRHERLVIDLALVADGAAGRHGPGRAAARVQARRRRPRRVMPRRIWLGVFGMARTTAGCPRPVTRLRIVAPATIETTTWSGVQAPAELAHHPGQHLGLHRERRSRQRRRGRRGCAATGWMPCSLGQRLASLPPRMRGQERARVPPRGRREGRR